MIVFACASLAPHIQGRLLTLTSSVVITCLVLLVLDTARCCGAFWTQVTESMHLVIAAAVLSCIALIFLVAFCRHFLRRDVRLPVTVDWIEELSIERYRPMLRLLSSEDVRFLLLQPGCTHATLARFRRERCQIFRRYLRMLEDDFQRVVMALKVVMAQSERDRPDLASALLESQIRFGTCKLKVECRVLLYRWGLGQVDVKGLLAIFDAVRLDLRALVPVTAANPA